MAGVSALGIKNLFTPASYAFSIWGLIYLALCWAFVIYQGRSLFKRGGGR